MSWLIAISAHSNRSSEFSTFLGVQGEIRQAFESYHAELFDAGWWKAMQARVEDGELIEIYPYDSRARLETRLR